MSERRFLVFNLIIAAAVGGAVLLGVRHASRLPAFEQPIADAQAIPSAPAAPRAPSPIEVLRALKLITVEIATEVSSESTDDSWRGDAIASVVAPVRLYFGVDLGDLPDTALLRDGLSGGWRILIPEPRRLAVEVVTDKARTSVRVTGTRLRDVAGEYHLGLARQRLHARASELVLTADQRALVERLTREQVATLVSTLTGIAPVDVRFESPERSVVGNGEAAR